MTLKRGMRGEGRREWWLSLPFSEVARKSLSGAALIEFAPNWLPQQNISPSDGARREPVKRRTTECGLIEAIKTRLLKDKQSSFAFEWDAIFSNPAEGRRLHSHFVECRRMVGGGGGGGADPVNDLVHF